MSTTEASVSRTQDSIIAFKGSLTRNSVPALWKTRKQWLGDELVSVDVSQVEVIDTAGVAFLLEIMKATQSTKTPLKCIGASDQLKQIASVSGVESLLSLS
jgi:phospholipid transport system transporter-binding protein